MVLGAFSSVQLHHLAVDKAFDYVFGKLRYKVLAIMPSRCRSTLTLLAEEIDVRFLCCRGVPLYLSGLRMGSAVVEHAA